VERAVDGAQSVVSQLCNQEKVADAAWSETKHSRGSVEAI
jgi:hypothetical protein